MLCRLAEVSTQNFYLQMQLTSSEIFSHQDFSAQVKGPAFKEVQEETP